MSAFISGAAWNREGLLMNVHWKLCRDFNLHQDSFIILTLLTFIELLFIDINQGKIGYLTGRGMTVRNGEAWTHIWLLDYTSQREEKRKRRQKQRSRSRARKQVCLNSCSDPRPVVMPITYGLITTLIIPQTVIVIKLADTISLLKTN